MPVYLLVLIVPIPTAAAVLLLCYGINKMFVSLLPLVMRSAFDKISDAHTYRCDVM